MQRGDKKSHNIDSQHNMHLRWIRAKSYKPLFRERQQHYVDTSRISINGVSSAQIGLSIADTYCCVITFS
jgi:hypothetical protein